MDKYIVFNPTNSVISFQLKPHVDLAEYEGVARHRVRRIVRGGFLPVTVQPHTSLDLVKFSGMSVDNLKDNFELHRHLRNGVLQLLETKLTVEVPDEIEEPEEEEIEEEIEEEEIEEEMPIFPSVPREEEDVEISTKVEKKEDTKKIKKSKKKGVKLFSKFSKKGD